MKMSPGNHSDAWCNLKLSSPDKIELPSSNEHTDHRSEEQIILSGIFSSFLSYSSSFDKSIRYGKIGETK